MKRIALFRSSFNPPLREHVRVVRQLSDQFDEVRIVPTGTDGNHDSGQIQPHHRATMADMAFAALPRVVVDLSELEEGKVRSAADWQTILEQAEIWQVVYRDSLDAARVPNDTLSASPASETSNEFQRHVVICPPGKEVERSRPSGNCQTLISQKRLDCREVRRAIYQHEPFRHWLPERVADYIDRHRLYQGTVAGGQCIFRLKECRFELVYDQHNEQAAALAREMARYQAPDPELLVVLGGDGTMLRAVRQSWRRRVPFYGVNIGHLGFLLNEQLPHRVAQQELVLWELPLLYVELLYQDGTLQHAWAFNDTWVERATGQTAWLEVRVDGQVRVPHLVADGALVATAAGSTAYARAMGAVPLPLGTPALLLVGSNVLRPILWRPVVLPVSAEVTLTTLDPVKRPLQAYVDGVAMGNVCQLRARASRVASVEMVFTPPHDPAAKLAAIQFPLH